MKIRDLNQSSDFVNQTNIKAVLFINLKLHAFKVNRLC